MNFQYLNKKLVVLGGGVVMVALVTVLGLAVWRVQNAAPTVTQPKAAGGCDTGFCCAANGACSCGVVSGVDCTGCSGCGGGGSSDSGSGLISGCKYVADDVPTNFCKQQNPAGSQAVNIYSSTGTQLIPKNDQKWANPYALGGLGKGGTTQARTHKVTVAALSGYDTESLVCNNTFMCYVGTDTTPHCKLQLDDSCSSSLPQPTVTKGNEVTVEIPADKPFKDGLPHLDIYWRFTKGAGWSYKAISPSGAINTLTPTFTWTNPASTSERWSNIAVYNGGSCAGAIRDYNAPAASDTSKAWSAFSAQGQPALAANTTYSWNIYGSDLPATSNCLSFTTGAGISCSTGQTLCGSTCMNLQTDNNNCGSCGNACTSNQTCTNGSCQITTTVTHLECGNNATCVAVAGVGNNLNGCTTAGQSCTTTQSCSSGQTLCGSSCVNLQTDTNNCGSCSNVCSSSQTCVSGSCTNSSQVSSCWGGGGTNGKCYDCNGDGVVNILDFSCFRAKYGNSPS
ncbi:MAG: hypothetical protein M1484_02070 [Patescibacteria group bacterium]|nr:hypothetical protein [Patescibacteria group bacterium]MCL5431867.1 hypothetical protein [Patescibacteria group bacterium]